MPDGALVAKRDAPVGGQAVLEGVMMRGISVWAVAVRKPGRPDRDQLRAARSRGRSATALWRLPVIRGVVALGESLKIGFRALAISANAQLEEDEKGEKEEIGGWVWGLTIALSLLLAIGLFFVVPVGLTSLIKDQLGSPVLFWLVEGVLRTAIFIGYSVAISRMPRPAAGLRVPRRRAQDDLLLRGRRRAGRRRGRSSTRACTRAAAPASC